MAVAETRLSQLKVAGETVDIGPYPVSLAFAALTCALAPTYIVRWHLSFYPSTLLEDAIGLTVVAFAIESWRMRASVAWRTAFTWPAALFLLAGAIDVAVPPDHRAALGIYRAYLVEPIAFFFVLVNVVRTPVQASLVGAGLAVAGTVVGVANSAVILNALRHHVYNVADTPPVVIYTNANDIALFLVPLIAMAGSLALFSQHRPTRLGAVAFLIVAVPSTLISFSRGGYLALAGVAIGLALVHRRRWLLISAAGVAAIVLILIPPITQRIGDELAFANPKNTLVGRSRLWEATLQMLQHHVPFGAGLSGFSKAIAPYWNATNPDRFIYPHNFVLTFWSETGLLGLAAFIWILVTGFVIGWRGWKSADAGWRPLGLGLVLAFVAVFLHGLVDVPYFKNDLALEFWAIVGLGTAWTVVQRRAGQALARSAR